MNTCKDCMGTGWSEETATICGGCMGEGKVDKE